MIVKTEDVELLVRIAHFWLERVKADGPRPRVDQMLRRVRRALHRETRNPAAARGGRARARAARPERRRAIAQQAATARWHRPTATG